MLISSLEFASVTQYCPRGGVGPKVTDAFAWRVSLKNDKILLKSRIPASEKVAELLEHAIREGRLQSFWDPDVILVPIPRSAAHLQNSIWIPWNIATAIVRRNLARAVVPALIRTISVDSSHTSYGTPRLPEIHYQTVSVSNMLLGDKVVLVDDFVTSGATFLGCASRLLEVLPGLSVKAFAGARVLRNGQRVDAIYSAVSGIITLQENGRTVRSP